MDGPPLRQLLVSSVACAARVPSFRTGETCLLQVPISQTTGPSARRYQDVPLVADVHHQGSDIAVEVAKYVDKVRINPGLFVFRKRVQREIEYSQQEIQEELTAIEDSLVPVIEACKKRDIAMRIGVN